MTNNCVLSQWNQLFCFLLFLKGEASPSIYADWVNGG